MRNKSTVLRWSGRAAVVIGVLAVAIYLALTSLYDTHAPVVTTLLFLLVTGIVAIALTSQFPLWLVLPELLLGLGFLAALAGSWPEPTAGALASVLRSPALWGTLAIVAGGMALLAALGRWPRTARRWLWLLTYLVASGGLAAWWYWGPARSQLAALPHLSQLDHQALAYLPAVLAIGTGAQLLLGLLIPHGAWRKAAIADLTATLVLMLAPVTAQVLPQRTPLPFEGTFHIAWLAAFLILLVVLRAAVAFAFLLGAARDWVQPGRKRDERRLALALLVLCLLVYWPVGLWRSSALGLTGDEPQYLAATMSLWQHHNLELTDGMFSGWMAEHVFDRENDLRVDIYEDQKADRMLFSRAWGTPRQTIYLPLVGGDQTATTIELLNPNLESASAQITYRDDKGTDVTTQQVTIAPGATAVLPAVQGAGQQLSAAIEAAKPVLAAALVGGQAGRELYFGGVALPRQCIPVHLDDRAWSTQLRVQNVLPTAATVTWQRLDANGAKLADDKLQISANGAASVPIAVGAAPGAVCIAADGPVSLLLVSQSTPGLLIQQGIAPQQAPVIIPQPAQSFAAYGKREALIHNPGSDPVQVTITMTGAAPQTMTIPPHGTQQFRFVIEQFGGGAIGDSGVIQPHGPVVVNILQVTGNQAAALAPDSSAEKNLVMPVIETGANLYALSQLELTNPGRTDTMAIVVLKDQHGQMIWQDKVWVTAGATVSHPFWYKAPASAVLSVQADQPLTGTLLQHEVKTHWPFHPIGLSVALLPGYALGGYPGALATVSLFAALLVVTVYSLMRWVGIQPRRALIVAAIMAFSPPISTYAVQLYPDLAGTLLLLVGLLGVLSWRAGRWWGAVAGGLGIALAPFFHTRLLPLSVLIVVVLIVTMVIAGLRRASLRRRVASLGLLGAVVIVLGALLAVVVLSEQRFRASYLERYFAPRGIGQHALGILFDRTSGLLPYMPVLLIATAGFYWLARRAPYLGFTVLGVVGAQLLLAAARHDGWEVWGPPARYILPAVPFAALALGAVWEWSFGRLRRGLAVALAGWGLVTTTFAAWFPLGLYYTTAHYSFGDQLVRGLTGGNPLDLFPVIQVVHPPTRAATVGVVLALAGGALLGLRLARSRPRRLPELAPAPELAGKAADRA